MARAPPVLVPCNHAVHTGFMAEMNQQPRTQRGSGHIADQHLAFTKRMGPSIRDKAVLSILAPAAEAAF